MARTCLGTAGAILILASAATALELVERPMLVLDPGMHVAPILRLDVDADGTTAATGSLDGTVRIWNTADGKLQKTIRLPRNPGNVGKIYALALSPDGATIAVGGWTRFSEDDPQEQIYLFDAADGSMSARIDGLPNVALDLAFSPDGARLAATLGGGFGLRLYSLDAGWVEIETDHRPYGDRSQGVAFAPDGRLATTSYDGHVRLYDANGRFVVSRDLGPATPFGLAFSPDGSRLAVGHFDQPTVTILDGLTLADEAILAPPAGPDADLTEVAWSADGRTLYAGGKLRQELQTRVLAWDGGTGPPQALAAALNTLVGIQPLPGGDILVAASDPLLGRLGPEGELRWDSPPQKMDARDQHETLAVSANGMVVDFDMSAADGPRARFDVAALTLTADPPADGLTEPPEQRALPLADWNDHYRPRLDRRILPLERFETSRSVAVAPDGRRFVLGTEWFLRAFDADGTALWRRETPGNAWAVNISGDGRLVVVAYDDGTLRWHRIEDGVEVLALFPLADGSNWVLWTPEGIYAASAPARGVLRWHVNRGWDMPGDAVPVSDIPQTLRPEVLKHVLPQLGTSGALAVAELAEIRGAVQSATRASVAPGARLHMLTVGVGTYGENARHLDLQFADDDAYDLASALLTSQQGLYSGVLPQVLRDSEATRPGILRALASMRAAMAAGDGNDLAVVHFSGHGAMVDESFYLLTHDVDARDPVAISETALDAARLQREIALLAQHGRIVVLLDACRSGASTSAGAELATDAGRLAQLMRGPNVTVLTSSTADENSFEAEQWKNGAFTEAVLEALTTRADADSNGVITMVEMASYVTHRVPEITGGRQTPGIDMRFESSVFVAGL